MSPPAKAFQVILIWKEADAVDFYYLNAAMRDKDAEVLSQIRKSNGKTVPFERMIWFIEWAKKTGVNRYRMNHNSGKILGSNDQEIQYAVPKDVQLLANYVLYVE